MARIRILDQTGSGVRVSSSLQIVALKTLLHSAGITSGVFSVGVISGGNICTGLSPEIECSCNKL